MAGPRVASGRPDPGQAGGEFSKAFASVLDAMNTSRQVNAMMEQVKSQERLKTTEMLSELVTEMVNKRAAEHPEGQVGALREYADTFGMLVDKMGGDGNLVKGNILADYQSGNFTPKQVIDRYLVGAVGGAFPAKGPEGEPSTPAETPAATPPAGPTPEEESTIPTSYLMGTLYPGRKEEVEKATTAFADSVMKGAPRGQVDARGRDLDRARNVSSTPEEQYNTMLKRSATLQGFIKDNPDAAAYMLGYMKERQQAVASATNPLYAAMAAYMNRGELTPEQQAEQTNKWRELNLKEIELKVIEDKNRFDKLSKEQQTLLNALDDVNKRIDSVKARYSVKTREGDIKVDEELLARDKEYRNLLQNKAKVQSQLYPENAYEVKDEEITIKTLREGILGQLGNFFVGPKETKVLTPTIRETPKPTGGAPASPPASTPPPAPTNTPTPGGAANLLDAWKRSKGL